MCFWGRYNSPVMDNCGIVCPCRKLFPTTLHWFMQWGTALVALCPNKNFYGQAQTHVLSLLALNRPFSIHHFEAEPFHLLFNSHWLMYQGRSPPHLKQSARLIPRVHSLPGAISLSSMPSALFSSAWPHISALVGCPGGQFEEEAWLMPNQWCGG